MKKITAVVRSVRDPEKQGKMKRRVRVQTYHRRLVYGSAHPG